MEKKLFYIVYGYEEQVASFPILRLSLQQMGQYVNDSTKEKERSLKNWSHFWKPDIVTK